MAAIVQTTLLDQLRARTGITSDVVSDADAEDIIIGALDEYNAHRPCMRMTAVANAITTVSSQPNYAIPSDALWVVEVCWSPFDMIDDDTTGSLESFLEEVYLGSLNDDHPSEIVAFRQGMAKWSQLFRGSWKIINGEIWLIPPPTSNGDHVAVCYAKANTLADLGSVKDQEFFNLCKACLKERWGMELNKVVGRAGSYTYPAEAARLILQKAEREHRMCINRISRNFVVERGASGSFVRGQR